MIFAETAEPVRILLVEDNPGDVRLTKEALKESRICNEILVARDGEEAMSILRQKKEGGKVSIPQLILLDLNLPKKDGREVLKEIKADEMLKRIPVIVLTTSASEEDILKSYNLHANCYITKPVDLKKFLKIMKITGDFWFSIVQLPPLNN